MSIIFFNHEVENPFLKALIVLGAVVFTAALGALIIALGVPVLGVILTALLLVLLVVLILVLVFVPLISFVGLLASNRKRGSGISETRVLHPEPFHSVEASGNAVLTVTFGKTRSVSMETDDNLMEFVMSEVKNGCLRVGFSRPVSSKLGLKVQMETDQLRKIKLTGAANARVKGIDCPEFRAITGGSAGIDLQGETQSFSLKVSGTSTVRASELHSKSAEVRASGSGKAHVHAAERLKAKVSGAALITCAGNPGAVTEKVSGTGVVRMVQSCSQAPGQ
jgi:hypothetical protein